MLFNNRFNKGKYYITKLQQINQFNYPVKNWKKIGILWPIKIIYAYYTYLKMFQVLFKSNRIEWNIYFLIFSLTCIQY